MRLDVPINTLGTSGNLKQRIHYDHGIAFFHRSVQNLHLAASRTHRISIEQKLQDAGFEQKKSFVHLNR
jgi:hypothetical protein